MRRLLAAGLVGIALGAVAAPPLSAQEDKQERLRRLLEDKFGTQPPATTRSFPAPRQVPQQPNSDADDDNEAFVIRPDGSLQKTTPQQVQPGKRSSLPLRFAAADAFAGGGGDRVASDAPVRLAQDSSTPGDSQSGMTGQATDGRPNEREKRQQFMVKKRTFIIQLKPDATSEQIDELITRYNLTVKRHVASLGVLYVESNRRPHRDGERSEGAKTRSLTKPPRETLSTVLEPRIVTEIRKHPAVDAAFVDSTIGPRTLPKRSDSKVQTPQAISRWTWDPSATDDGNWGLKVMRMPAVWTILARSREANKDRPRTRVSFLDSGFGNNRQVVFKEVWGGLPAGPVIADCGRSHGTHVAGIVGATFGGGFGIDGAVPEARLEAIPITRELLNDSSADGTDQAQQHVSFFMDAIADLSEFLDQSPLATGERRVVNVSLAYNWAGVALAAKADGTGSADPTANKVIRDQVRQHAKVVQTVVSRYQDRILFVSAAGNDSDGLAKPVGAEFATPFAYAGTQGAKPSPNIIVVEAKDRAGERASFSNVGGHVAAPGVDIMSTLASDRTPYGVCSGTSQAAPHVSALAAILFELAPQKTPAEIVSVIRTSAVASGGKGSAPLVDGLAAVLAVAPESARYLADLTGDGKVDAADVEEFKRQLVLLEEAKFGANAIETDLNGDGQIDEYERCWPRIDLNGSGRASYQPEDTRLILGEQRSDLDMLKMSWTDTTTTFEQTLKASGLAELMAVWQSTSIVASVEESGKSPCQ